MTSQQLRLAMVAQTLEHFTRTGRLRPLIGGEVKVLLALLSFTTDSAWNEERRLICRPSQSEIAERMDIHLGSVRRALPHLEELGLIKRIVGGGGRGDTNIYEISVDGVEGAPPPKESGAAAEPAEKRSPETKFIADLWDDFLGQLAEVSQVVIRQIDGDGASSEETRRWIKVEKRIRQTVAALEQLDELREAQKELVQ